MNNNKSNSNKLYSIVEADEENGDEILVDVIPTNNQARRIRMALAAVIVLFASFVLVFAIPRHYQSISSGSNPASNGLPQDDLHHEEP